MYNDSCFLLNFRDISYNNLSGNGVDLYNEIFKTLSRQLEAM